MKRVILPQAGEDRERGWDTKTASTQPYLHADTTIKEKGLARVQPRGTLLAFLDSLLPSPAGLGLCRACSEHRPSDQHVHFIVGIIPESA